MEEYHQKVLFQNTKQWDLWREGTPTPFGRTHDDDNPVSTSFVRIGASSSISTLLVRLKWCILCPGTISYKRRSGFWAWFTIIAQFVNWNTVFSVIFIASWVSYVVFGYMRLLKCYYLSIIIFDFLCGFGYVWLLKFYYLSITTVSCSSSSSSFSTGVYNHTCPHLATSNSMYQFVVWHLPLL